MSDEPTAKFHLIRLEKVAEGLGVPFGWLHKKAKEGKITCLRCDRVILADPRVVANEINLLIEVGSTEKKIASRREFERKVRQKHVEAEADLKINIAELKSQVDKAIKELAKSDVAMDKLKRQHNRQITLISEKSKEFVGFIHLDQIQTLILDGEVWFDYEDRHIHLKVVGGVPEHVVLMLKTEICALNKRMVLAESRIEQMNNSMERKEK